MKKKQRSKVMALGLAIGLFSSGSVLATESQDDVSTNSIHSWELGAELSSIKYEEPGLMEETGVMIGIGGSYTYHNNIMFKAEGVFKYGQVDYEGGLQDGTPLNVDNIDDYIVEIRGLGGYDFPVSTSTTLTPYIGLGYRYLFDDFSAASIYGYGRESNYLYSPIGIKTLTKLQNGWSIGVTVEYDLFWSGKQTSSMSDFQPGFNDVENDQNDGYGLRGSITLQKSNFIIEPFVRYWNIDDSDPSVLTYYGYPVNIIYEPENNSTEIGLKLAWEF
ncbi:MAG: autotransporter outer membrane beta-barrel domain-containing protein [Proteobacteria bacterium]|nr:autotransporter outer membrane beta-barrel domain-containing protein [Pseudomonadota bacterium]